MTGWSVCQLTVKSGPNPFNLLTLSDSNSLLILFNTTEFLENEIN